MSFADAIATQPAWVQYWVSAMGLVIVGSVIALLFQRATRRDAIVIVVTMAATFAAMTWLYGRVGYVRLLGIVHIVLWIPLAIYLLSRLKDPEIVAPFRQVIWLLIATLAVSLAFDLADVARYLLGERESMIPSKAGAVLVALVYSDRKRPALRGLKWPEP